MAELHMLSHAVISAFLARMTDPEPILAAYSIAFYLHATLGSPVWACQFVAISFIRNRASVIRLFFFSTQTFLLVGWLWALIALTPLGLSFFIQAFGVSEAVAKEAQLCVLISTLIVPCVFFRSLAYALLMLNRRTTLVTLGTMIRLIGLFVILIGLQGKVNGALVGMIALTACIAIESFYAVIAARKYYLNLPANREPPPKYRELWRFGWPVILMQIAESGVAFTASFFLGRLLRPELALAAFGVLDAMMRVLLGPLRNLTQAVQTLTKNRSDAIVIGFNVRPMGNARTIADKEEIDIRSYSIIYDAINDIKDAMEGMLSPEMREEITGNAEIRETFKISKIGTIAGCMVTSGKIYRNSGIRIIREGVVIFTGGLTSLKRFKDDVKEVAKGYDCGLQVKNYNDIKVGDVLECFQEVAVKKSL